MRIRQDIPAELARRQRAYLSAIAVCPLCAGLIVDIEVPRIYGTEPGRDHGAFIGKWTALTMWAPYLLGMPEDVEDVPRHLIRPLSEMEQRHVRQHDAIAIAALLREGRWLSGRVTLPILLHQLESAKSAGYTLLRRLLPAEALASGCAMALKRFEVEQIMLNLKGCTEPARKQELMRQLVEAQRVPEPSAKPQSPFQGNQGTDPGQSGRGE